MEKPTMDDPMVCTVAARHANICGSMSNAMSTVFGLRTGGPITLQNDHVRVSFTLPTPGLNWREVDRAIELAGIGLNALGIYQPTPYHLQIALDAALTGMYRTEVTLRHLESQADQEP